LRKSTSTRGHCARAPPRRPAPAGGPVSGLRSSEELWVPSRILLLGGVQTVTPRRYDQNRWWLSIARWGLHMRHHTKDKGDIGLGCVMADLLKHDIQVALPVSEHLPFDLIAIHPRGHTLKVSVKYRVMSSHGSITVRSRSVWNDRNGTHYRRHSVGDYDAVAIYCPDTDECYYLRASELSPLCTTLRITEPVNRQKNGVNMARRFTDPVRLFVSAPVAQWIEQPASNRQVEGSIPSGGASSP
jgi:hypothetical protein